ncbi:MAG TPA: uroporphyrinogen decarboxylase family protein [Methylobacter sp.]
MVETMTSMERVITILERRVPDRVPFFLPVTMHGAPACGLSIEEYFSKPDLIVEAQLHFQQRFGHDALVGYTFAAREAEAFGQPPLYYLDGPPNAGAPCIREFADIDRLRPPRISDCPGLQSSLAVQRGLKAAVGESIFIVGLALSPFSLPVMQMGFDAYLRLMHEDEPRFLRLMEINAAFCVDWVNAQFAAGATTVVFYDPVGSSTIVTDDLYQRLCLPVEREILAQVNGPMVAHFAGAHALSRVDALCELGFPIVCVSTFEDLAEAKVTCEGKIALCGNLNAITMRNWDTAATEAEVRLAIQKGGPGGGFLLTDNHGEIPFQVPLAVLDTIAATVRREGGYSLQAAAGTK